jgi:hypothetical protein
MSETMTALWAYLNVEPLSALLLLLLIPIAGLAAGARR